MRVNVYLSNTVSLVVPVEIPDDTDEDSIEDVATSAALDAAPYGVCAQCSGLDHDWRLDLDGEWELDEATPE